MPSAQPRPTTTIHGMPISSASLNFTPGDACRSSRSTSTPAGRVGGQLCGAGPGLVVLVGDDHVHVVRRHRRRPAQALVVVMLLGDDRDQPRDPDAVRAHGRPDRLAVLAEHVDVERVGVLAAQLEDVADLDAARAYQRAGAVG